MNKLNEFQRKQDHNMTTAQARHQIERPNEIEGRPGLGTTSTQFG
ncbi:hypothetical protein [Sporosarcina sp. P34]|nr:hypothetical protein [Sporosarcina sp. P34]